MTTKPDEMDVDVTVTNVEEGTVTLSTLQPRIGTALTASLTDIDGAVSASSGVGERLSGVLSPETIMEADSDTYTPVMADDTMLLRATARYTDT